MGVKGLWSLLNPVARPVQIESMEGKRLAIDSSIWLYQFQATMRDKDGRVLVNAHVLGFLRRINKLLFHGIKPVFVFDGGAPALKRNTIAERKRKKQGAAINHAKAAEKLFAAQMRREAVKAAQAQREQQAARDAASAAAAASRYDDEVGDTIDENAVYLEDLERGGGGPPRPPPPPVAGPSTTSRPPPDTPPDPREERRKKFRKHDPYRLPETTMPTVSTEDKPDARLATEAELQHFIDEMRPSDIDVESAEFRALPTEVQYEIIGDLRIRSRQQSHKRLTDMLRRAPTSLDFSMAQIKGLAQRNALTQQLLTVTDMVGKAHLTIPVRIAAERNREYVLLKRGEDVGGGWALGIREGTKQKPIHVEEEVDGSGSSSGYSSDSDVEEIKPEKTDDGEVVERRRKLLEAITSRYAPAKPARRPLDAPVVPFGAAHAPSQPHLFAPAEDEDDEAQEEIVPTANDEALALALQQEELGSDEDEADPELARALAMSRRESRRLASDHGGRGGVGGSAESEERAGSDDSFEEVSLEPSTRTTPALDTPRESPREEDEENEDDFEEVEAPPIPAPTARSVPPSKSAVGQPTHSAMPATGVIPVSSVGIAGPSGENAKTQPPLLRPQREEVSRLSDAGDRAKGTPEVIRVLDDDDEEDIVPIPAPSRSGFGRDVDRGQASRTSTNRAGEGRLTRPAEGGPTLTAGPSSRALPTVVPSRSSSLLNKPVNPSPLSRSSSFALEHRSESTDLDGGLVPARLPRRAPTPPSPVMPIGMVEPEPERMIDEALAGGRPSRTPSFTLPAPAEEEDDMNDDAHEEDDSRSIEWSRSPSPGARTDKTQRPPLQPNESAQSIGTDGGDEADEADEMNATDMADEQDDYARFLASIKNRDLNEVRTEIDDEIRVLNGQNKVAMRDSDEITLSMIAQIQTLLRHFGIPYITAPMEAEAQCAKLAELGLVDGIITDDSDVFLFGGVQCFKNIFNDAKYAECFLSSDVSRELSLSRDRLISLAFLLGSDYTIGLPGVGPVVALELLANFPGPRGIEDFKEWWGKVQTGRDGAETNTKWKQSFKKRYAQAIFLTADWPNPLVREAYLYPTVDESEEPFHWGFPKLSALRSYLHEELSWSISKVDDELVPIVQRIARRGKQGAMNKQTTLDPFFDLSAGALANYAPRRKTTANVSKRLLAIIKQYREAEARVAGESVQELGEMLAGVDERDPKGRGVKRGTSELVEVTDAAVAGATDPAGAEGPKRKRAVRRKKSDTADTMGSGVYGEEGDESPAAGPSKPTRTRKKAASVSEAGDAVDETGEVAPKPKRKRVAAATARDAIKRGSGVDGEMDDDEVPGYVADDITQVPPEERQKWRRAQQKKWRRAAVAGSVRPS